jgi:branched-chain amino acid transport system ATP-binding protein
MSCPTPKSSTLTWVPGMSELTVTGLAVEYGGISAVNDVDITVPHGSVITLLGANGAGKTSTVRAIMGLIRSAGQVALDDRPLAGTESFRRVRAGLGYVPEGRLVFAPMTVADNLAMGSYRQSRRAAAKTLEEVYDLFPVLRKRAGQAAGSLSGGEQQMLAIGRALVTNPTVLLLDEPLEGLAPIVGQDVGRQIARLVEREGMSTILVEQNVGFALRLTHQAIILERGVAVRRGKSQDLAQDRDALAHYVGLRRPGGKSGV